MKSKRSARFTAKELFYREGFFLQEEVYSCGPTTLQNLQVFFGLPVTPVQELIRLAKTTTHSGTEHTGIVEALTTLGIKTKDEKRDATREDLERALDRDCVCIVNYFNTFNRVGHFSLMIDHDDDAFYLIDSSLGFLRLRKKYFEQNWHNSDGSLSRWFVAVCEDQFELAQK